MKLHVLSDLHLEFQDFELPSTNADVVILAGDIQPGTKGLSFAQEHIPDKPVLYVAGNHEYYGEALPKLTDKLRKQATGTNVHFLENDEVILEGVRFLGCTLWTDFELCGSEQIETSMWIAGERMNDYRHIRKSPEYRRLTPFDTRRLHRSSRAWLAERLATPFNGATVVVTHHSPSVKSSNPMYHKDPLTAAFASDLEAFIEAQRPALWIHGHTHYCADYQLGATRVVTNTRGYPGEGISRFVPDLCVEV